MVSIGSCSTFQIVLYALEILQMIPWAGTLPPLLVII